MSLTDRDIEHIAALSRLAVSEEEKKLFATQLSSILAYVSELSQVDTSGIEYGYHVEGLEDVMDADAVLPSDDATRAALLDSMPDRAGDLLKVKSVFGE